MAEVVRWEGPIEAEGAGMALGHAQLRPELGDERSWLEEDLLACGG